MKQLISGLLALTISMSALAGWFGLGGTKWEAEVALSDGRKLMVDQWMMRSGRHEIGQQPPIKEQRLQFTHPATGERIEWLIERSEEVGYADLKPILLDVIAREVYLVTVPVGCLAYNKWGRPNPPYVVFNHSDREWRRINLTDLPAQITAPNLIISSPDNAIDRLGKNYITVEEVKNLNSTLRQPEYQTILREPLKAGLGMTGCESGWLVVAHRWSQLPESVFAHPGFHPNALM